mgnify:CR=1 FL=1
MALDDASLSIIQLLLRDFAAMTHSAPNVLERFLRYVQFDTQSDETSAAAPSTAKQLKLAEALTDELHQLGIGNAVIGQGGIVYAHIPASPGCEHLPLSALSPYGHVARCVRMPSQTADHPF